jgi:endogenous inhibitor of DNA gyrase (YacG/DUF329 family)
MIFGKNKTKINCFLCGKTVKPKNKVLHYIKLENIFWTLIFCSWKCHDMSIIDLSERDNVIALRW